MIIEKIIFYLQLIIFKCSLTYYYGELIEKLTDRQKEIIVILKQGPISRKQIIKRMQNPPSDRTMQADLLRLKTLSLIVQQGKARAIVCAINRAIIAQLSRNKDVFSWQDLRPQSQFIYYRKVAKVSLRKSLSFFLLPFLMYDMNLIMYQQAGMLVC